MSVVKVNTPEITTKLVEEFAAQATAQTSYRWIDVEADVIGYDGSTDETLIKALRAENFSRIARGAAWLLPRLMEHIETIDAVLKPDPNMPEPEFDRLVGEFNDLLPRLAEEAFETRHL